MSKSSVFALAWSVTFVCTFTPVFGGTVVYVDDNATSPNDGSSESSAFNDFQNATDMRTCASGDFDCDGDVDLLDFAASETCFTGPDGGPVVGECKTFDFDDDDDVDFADFAQLQPLVREDASPCACDGDVNGNGSFDPFDSLLLRQCIESAEYEEECDINCDGLNDWCDWNTFNCLAETGDPTCCETVVCGACYVPDGGCSAMTEQSCIDVGGLYDGDGSICHDP